MSGAGVLFYRGWLTLFDELAADPDGRVLRLTGLTQAKHLCVALKILQIERREYEIRL